MNRIVYNIPVDRIGAYRGQPMVVRSQDPAELARALSKSDLENLVGVQLLSLATDPEALADWGYAVPVELVMLDPAAEFPLLYRHAKLLDKHPVRASIPALPGFAKAVKVATSLQLTVKLEVGQPDAITVEEMLAVLDFYLHHSSVSQPIEFFHTSLMSFYHGRPVTLWDIQEEDPARVRYVADDGGETVSRRFVSGGNLEDLDHFVANLQSELRVEGSECFGCEFFENCGGYFKWPSRNYFCDGVKSILGTLKQAASDLSHDLGTLEDARPEVRR